ncbi:MAG TPA: N-acetylmuramoyl-L-alanine amidase [Acidimicrobiales bacterium]
METTAAATTTSTGGDVLAFAPAVMAGSLAGRTLNAPVVAMAATPTGKGYWLATSDGGVFSFGDAVFYGSAGSVRLNRPIVGLAATPTGRGYWLVASDGGIFSYGDATYSGSGAGTALARPVIAVVASPGGGYWMAEGQRGLVGHVVVIDPGHNGGNGAHPEIINQPVDIITGTKPCDTAGTATNDGYPEFAYNFDVASRASQLLQQAGATVILTHPDDLGVGPCITERAAIGNRADAAVAISIHADGGPPTGRGFHVIQPAPIAGHNTDIVGPSDQFATELRDLFLAETGMPTSDYIGEDGLDTRDDLGGLNLSTVPKVFIETGNMRNATDAGLLEDPAFRQRAAQAISDAMGELLS